MKKVLLSTSALVALTATGALAGGNPMPAAVEAPANTGGLTVMVGGYVDSQAGFNSQESAARTSTGAGEQFNDVNFANDAEIHVTALGSAENFDYGAVVELNANIDADAEADGQQADKTYVFVEGDDFGRFEFGGNEGASNTLEIDASNIARATGGIDGDWYQYADLDGLVGNTGNFTTAPNLGIADAEATAADASKLTYYTPRFSGIQAGVSYTPDTGDLGTTNALSGANGTDIENAIAAGLNYEGNFDNVAVMAAVVGEQGDYESGDAVNDSYQGLSYGAGVEVSGFSVAGNLSNQTNDLDAGGENEADTWSLGAAYENGPAGVSVTYFDSETDGAAGDDTLTNLVLGADYQLAPGFTPYVEAAFFEADEAGTTTDNEGSVVLVGAELAF